MLPETPEEDVTAEAAYVESIADTENAEQERDEEES